MCGIAGIASRVPLDDGDQACAREMVRRLRHRGPDGEAIDLCDSRVIFAHTRLAVIDIEGGHQPFFNEDRSVALVYNGEIYNFRELRSELVNRGIKFRTRSDTEVLLRLYEAEGMSGFRRLQGMYAFAIWDKQTRELILARDPFGMKPLHYANTSNRIIFGSELKSVLAHPSVSKATDPQAFHDLLNLRFVPAPATLLSAVRRVMPGWALVWKDGKVRESEIAAIPIDSVIPDPDRLEAEIERRFVTAVQRHLVADVPLGAYLSGGLDSSAVTAAMARIGVDPIRTFTLGFGNHRDENDQARATSEFFHTRHTDAVMSPDCLREYPKVLWHIEEPQVNVLQSYKVAGLARAQVKVVLSGMGGDELFGGYHTHRWMSLLKHAHGMSLSLSQRLAHARQFVSRVQSPFGPRADLPRRTVQVLLAAGDPAVAWSILRNCWDEDDRMRRRIYRGKPGFSPVVRHVTDIFDGKDPLRATFDAEMRLKLADDFLAGEDRTSMAHGLEVRVPFLDHDLVGLARGLSPAMHASRGRGKILYRRAIARLLPSFVTRRPKWGFSFDPVGQWEQYLAPYVRSRLTRENMERLDPVDPSYVLSLLNKSSGRTLRWHRFFLWTLAGYVDWHRMFVEDGGAPPAEATAGA